MGRGDVVRRDGALAQRRVFGEVDAGVRIVARGHPGEVVRAVGQGQQPDAAASGDEHRSDKGCDAETKDVEEVARRDERDHVRDRAPVAPDAHRGRRRVTTAEGQSSVGASCETIHEFYAGSPGGGWRVGPAGGGWVGVAARCSHRRDHAVAPSVHRLNRLTHRANCEKAHAQ